MSAQRLVHRRTRRLATGAGQSGLATSQRPFSRVTPIRFAILFASLVAVGGSLTIVATWPASAAPQRHAPARECTTVADVLSDGPTVNADPVGYAEAQILPLKQLELRDRALKKAVAELDAAYKAFSDSNGSPKSARKVTVAAKRLDAICPNAAP